MFDINFNTYLPSYLQETDKARLRRGLEQFKRGETEITCTDFFLSAPPNYLMQGDILHSVKLVDWDEDNDDYYSSFTSAILLSNTCDVAEENERSINRKESILAPIISFGDYVFNLKEDGFSDAQISTYEKVIKSQQYTNIFYIPKNEKNEKDYIVFLDRMVFHPTVSLLKNSSDLADSRFLSLTNLSFYLLLFKISYHFCRLPEEMDRRENLPPAEPVEDLPPVVIDPKR